MDFILYTGMDRNEIHNPSVRDINVAIDSLDPDHEDAVVVLVISEERDEFIQVHQYFDSYSIINYHVEFRIGTIDNFKQYSLHFTNKEIVKKYFIETLLTKKLPASDGWEDSTTFMKNYDDIYDTFSIFDIAKKNHRNNNEIINCHNLFHGSVIRGSIVYQFIAEAIVLCKTILESDNSYGEIYYTIDKRLFYIDIVFPETWQTFIKKVYRIRGVLGKNFIHISSFDKENSFIQTKVNPLYEYEKLLTCFLLLFVRKIIKNDNYLFSVMRYCCLPEKELFEEIYTEFVNDVKDFSCKIGYIEDRDFDNSRYLPLSELYRNFKENMEM